MKRINPNSQNGRKTKKSKTYDSLFLCVLVTMYKNLAQEILILLDYYSKLNLSFVCKDLKVLRPLRITLGVNLKKRLQRHRNYKFSQEIPNNYLAESVFEITLMDLALFKEYVKEENRTQYNQIKFVRVYTGFNYSALHLTVAKAISILSECFKKLEILEFVHVDQEITIDIKPKQFEKLKSIKVFTICDDITTKYIVTLKLGKLMEEVGLYSKYSKQMKITCAEGCYIPSCNVVGNGIIDMFPLFLLRGHPGINY